MHICEKSNKRIGWSQRIINYCIYINKLWNVLVNVFPWYLTFLPLFCQNLDSVYQKGSSSNNANILDGFLDLGRNLFPDNLFEASFKQVIFINQYS